MQDIEAPEYLTRQTFGRIDHLLDGIKTKIYADKELPLMVLVYSQTFQQVRRAWQDFTRISMPAPVIGLQFAWPNDLQLNSCLLVMRELR